MYTQVHRNYTIYVHSTVQNLYYLCILYCTISILYKIFTIYVHSTVPYRTVQDIYYSCTPFCKGSVIFIYNPLYRICTIYV